MGLQLGNSYKLFRFSLQQCLISRYNIIWNNKEYFYVIYMGIGAHRKNLRFSYVIQTYKVGAHFEALIEGVLMAPMDSRYSQVGFNLVSVQV